MCGHRAPSRPIHRREGRICWRAAIFVIFCATTSVARAEPPLHPEWATIPANPVLGPFLPAGRQIAQSVSTFVTHGGKEIAEYGHLLNMRSVSGFGAEAGAKTNLGVFTYVEEGSGNVWGSAIDLQLSSGDKRINVNTQEIDLNNYRMDYKTPGLPASVGLQLFFGGPNRSSTGIALGEQGRPRDPAHVVNGITLCCETLISDSSMLDLTNSSVSINVKGSHKIGLNLASASNFSAFQVNGKGWSVDPEGSVKAKAYAGVLHRPSSSQEACVPGQFEDDENYHYVCVDQHKWKRVKLQDY